MGVGRQILRTSMRETAVLICAIAEMGHGGREIILLSMHPLLMDIYAYRAHDVKKILLARVLTGFSYFSPPKRFVKLPLLSSVGGTRGHVQCRYNSVTGQLDGSTIYIIYENDFAYPAYIIAYSWPSSELSEHL